MNFENCFCCYNSKSAYTYGNPNSYFQFKFDWSEFLAANPEVWVRFPALANFLRSSGPGTGSTQPHEDKWGATFKRISGSSIENWDLRPCGIRSADHATPLYSQTLAINFANKWRSNSRYSSLADQGPRSFVVVFVHLGNLLHQLASSCVSKWCKVRTAYRIHAVSMCKCKKHQQHKYLHGVCFLWCAEVYTNAETGIWETTEGNCVYNWPFSFAKERRRWLAMLPCRC
jgi:hypothetical protein